MPILMRRLGNPILPLRFFRITDGDRSLIVDPLSSQALYMEEGERPRPLSLSKLQKAEKTGDLLTLYQEGIEAFDSLGVKVKPDPTHDQTLLSLLDSVLDFGNGSIIKPEDVRPDQLIALGPANRVEGFKSAEIFVSKGKPTIVSEKGAEAVRIQTDPFSLVVVALHEDRKQRRVITADTGLDARGTWLTFRETTVKKPFRLLSVNRRNYDALFDLGRVQSLATLHSAACRGQSVTLDLRAFKTSGAYIKGSQ